MNTFFLTLTVGVVARIKQNPCAFGLSAINKVSGKDPDVHKMAVCYSLTH